MPKRPDEKCPKCGQVYEVFEGSLMARDKDSFECDCGHTMRSWNGAVMFNYKEKPSQTDEILQYPVDENL